MTLREEIREAMNRQGITQYELAQWARVHKSSISRFLSGKRGLGSDSLDRIREQLGVDEGDGGDE